MCGFVGAFSPTAEVCSIQTLIKMRDTMIHRGPDDADVWRARSGICGLAHRRLSIIDLSPNAKQPMSNHDESVLIVFNGEVYNHREIRDQLTACGKYQWRTDHSDTEVILHAYEEWGLEAFHKCYGMFSVAIFDNRNPSKPHCHLIRDRVGIKPLYVLRTHKGEWLFASEIRALLAHPDVYAEMDDIAFWHYLTFIVAPAPYTLFKNIWKIPAAHMVTIDHTGEAHAWRWWDNVPTANNTLTTNDLSLDEAGDEVIRLLKQSIERRMVSDVPFGVLLSGGVDSSMNVALMSELMDRPVETFTIGYEQYEDSNEFQFAERVAKQFHTNHHTTRINSAQVLNFLPELIKTQDEPIADNVCIPLYFLSKLVKDSGTKVVQVGEGADENFLGYWWCDHYKNKYEQIYKPIFDQTVQSWWKRRLKNSKRKLSFQDEEDRYISYRASVKEELFWGGAVCWWGSAREQLTPNPQRFSNTAACPIHNLLPASFQSLNSHEIIREYVSELGLPLSEPTVLQKIPFIEHRLRLPEHLLMRVDKMSMAHSIEARVPFLDHHLIEFTNKLPLSYKLNNGVGKIILKKIAEKYLPNDLLYRKKQGFGAPMENWFKEVKFAKWCQSSFENSQLLKAGYLDKKYVMALFNKQVAGGGGHSFQLWTLLNAVLWYEISIDHKMPSFS